MKCKIIRDDPRLLMVQGGHCLDLFGQSKPKTATGYSIVCFDVTVLAIS